MKTRIALILASSIRFMAADMTDQTFKAVKEIFEKQGAKVERDMSTPKGRTVRIYLPPKTAISITKEQAETLASYTKSKLGDNAIVYIKGPGGNTLGKAD